MASVGDLRKKIEDAWPSNPAVRTCLVILEQLIDAPSHQLRHLTFLNLARMAAKSDIDEDLVMAVNMLSSSPLNVVELHFSFIDEADRESELSDDDIRDYQISGVLVDPKSGTTIGDADQHLLPFFAASDEFLKSRERR